MVTQIYLTGGGGGKFLGGSKMSIWGTGTSVRWSKTRVSGLLLGEKVIGENQFCVGPYG